jgi:hypothetical protein
MTDRGNHNPSSPAGQIESVGAFATGLTHLTGRRRTVVRWLVVGLFALPFLVVVAAHLLT